MYADRFDSAGASLGVNDGRHDNYAPHSRSEFTGFGLRVYRTYQVSSTVVFYYGQNDRQYVLPFVKSADRYHRV